MGVDNFLSGLPIIGGLFDDSQDKAQQQIAKNQALYAGLNTPTFDKYTPNQYQYVGNYNPDAAQATTVSEDPATRDAQMSAMMKMSGLANTGLSDVDNLGYLRAHQLGDQISHSGTESALQNAEARGMGGSGMEFAMREKAAQDAAGRAQDAGMQQAGDAARMRAMYTQALGGLGGQIRGQDFANNAANAGILNNFSQYNTGARNAAQQYNLGQQQGISNANVSNENEAQQYNNQMKQQSYQDQLSKANGQAGSNMAAANGYAAQNAANQGNRNTWTSIGVDALLPGAGAAIKKSTAPQQ